MLNIVLLPLFVLFNAAALIFLVRSALGRSQWLRDPEERAQVLRDYTQDELAEEIVGLFHRMNYRNPLRRLLFPVSLIGSLLVADYHTIRYLWPWLLP